MSSSQHPRSRGSDWLALGRAQIRVPMGSRPPTTDRCSGGSPARQARSGRRRCRSAACRRSSFGRGGEQGRGRPRFSSRRHPARAQASGVPRDRPRPGGRWASGHRGRAGGSRRGRVDAGGREPGAGGGRGGLVQAGRGSKWNLASRRLGRRHARPSDCSRSAPHRTGVDRPRTRPVVRRRGGDSGRHDGRLPGRRRARAVHGR